MKLTQDIANEINVGDYIKIDHGNGVYVEGAVYGADPAKGLWIDRPDGTQRVYGPSIFGFGLDITWPKEHPKMVREDESHHFQLEATA